MELYFNFDIKSLFCWHIVCKYYSTERAAKLLELRLTDDSTIPRFVCMHLNTVYLGVTVVFCYYSTHAAWDQNIQIKKQWFIPGEELIYNDNH